MASRSWVTFTLIIVVVFLHTQCPLILLLQLWTWSKNCLMYFHQIFPRHREEQEREHSMAAIRGNILTNPNVRDKYIQGVKLLKNDSLKPNWPNTYDIFIIWHYYAM